jgi:hypothetical protein
MTVDHFLFSDSTKKADTKKAATSSQQWYVTISRGRRGIHIFTRTTSSFVKILRVLVIARWRLNLQLAWLLVVVTESMQLKPRMDANGRESRR